LAYIQREKDFRRTRGVCNTAFENNSWYPNVRIEGPPILFTLKFMNFNMWRVVKLNDPIRNLFTETNKKENLAKWSKELIDAGQKEWDLTISLREMVLKNPYPAYGGKMFNFI